MNSKEDNIELSIYVDMFNKSDSLIFILNFKNEYHNIVIHSEFSHPKMEIINK